MSPKTWKHTSSHQPWWHQNTAAGREGQFRILSYHGFFVADFSRPAGFHHCKTPMKLRMAKRMKRQPDFSQTFAIFCWSSKWFLPVRPNKGPSKWSSLSQSFDDCIGGGNFHPQAFPWENKMIHATTALPIGSMYDIFLYIWSISVVNVGRYTIHGSYRAMMLLLMFFLRFWAQKLEKHWTIDAMILPMILLDLSMCRIFAINPLNNKLNMTAPERFSY